MKVCLKCNQEKEDEEFRLRGKNRVGLCRKCRTDYTRDRYNSDPNARKNQQESAKAYKARIRKENAHLICPTCDKMAKDEGSLEEHLQTHQMNEGKSLYQKYRRGTKALRDYEESKNKFLGLNHGTARNQLKNLFLFKLIVETGRNQCHRCGNPMTAEDFSIEHIKDWLWVDPTLFWDLNNISFSHRKCNYASSRKTTKIISPEGMSWCGKCKQHLPLAEFPKAHHSPELGKKKTRHCTKCNNKRTLKAKHIQEVF